MEKKHLILIVDDLQENRLLLRKIIESMDCNVQEAANGKEGLEIARLHKPDLIISDVLMPVIDGYRFCIEVKKDDKLKDIPFIFYTATYTDKKDEEFAMSIGAEKFLIKPMEPEVLRKRLKTFIEECEKGSSVTPRKIIEEEKDVFRLYSERLINKLEKKMLDLENEVTNRKQAEKELKKHREHLEELVKERTKELEEKNKQLEHYNRLFEGREFRIKELKDKVKELKERLGE